jgi:hypothetical protein
MSEHLSLLCKLQRDHAHRPCRSQECDCAECYPLPVGKYCECWCHPVGLNPPGEWTPGPGKAWRRSGGGR